jgi:hypothetical protein
VAWQRRRCRSCVVDQPNVSAAVVGAAFGFQVAGTMPPHLTRSGTKLRCDTVVFGLQQTDMVLDVGEMRLRLTHTGRIGRGIGVIVTVGD